MIRHFVSLALCAILVPAALSAPPATPAPAKAAATPAPAKPGLSPVLKMAHELAGKKDFEGAMKLLRTEAEKGNAEAANALGELYLAGRGDKASPAEAVRWFEKAAASSYPPGMYNLSTILAQGAEGVPANQTKAKFLTKAAAEAGFGDAQVRMGGAAESEAASKPGTPDFTEARAWYEKAAAQENVGGLLALMRFSDAGMGGPLNLGKGTEYCLRAVRAGSIMAMNEMGVRYQRGMGVPDDRVAAIGWFALAAQYNQPAALVNLGNCYETGNGTKKDYDTAGRNYAAAVKLGFGPAEYHLAQMIEEGLGAKANPADAYVLYTRAAVHGVEEAKKKAEDLKAKLTPEQLEEAAKLLKKGSNP